jgi:non-specific serine/threonine protein kinase
MAPELLQGAAPSEQSDLYALGALLYRFASGRYPVTAATLRQLLARHAKGARISLAELRPDLAPEVASAIERALHSDPAERYGDAQEMGSALTAALGLAPPARASAPTVAGTERLPQAHDRFVGRERELAAVRRLVHSGAVVTLTGPGGSGKTRLALQAARELAGAFAGGVFWADLGPMSDAAQLLPHLVRILDLQEEPAKSLEQILREHLAGRSLLLVLDNCEHLRAECARAAELLRNVSPRIRLLATSRIALGLAGEAVHAVRPLSVPPPARGGGPAIEITEYDSVRLFLDRANRSHPGFVVTRANGPAIARICRRLDGIPLAIELAAARVRVMSVEEIDRRLLEDFRVLGAAEGERLPRQKTLAASIEWSRRLLSEAERLLLRRLAVFAGRWTLAAAESVCRDSREKEPVIGGVSILDAMTALADSSLISLEAMDLGPCSDEEIAAQTRQGYRMLEMVRQYARVLLIESGEEEALQLRHLQYGIEASRAAAKGLLQADEAYWARRLDWEHENYLSMLRWAQRAPEHADGAMRIAAELRRYWNARGLLSVGRGVLESLLTLPALSPTQRGRGLTSLAQLSEAQGDRVRARALCEEALVFQRAAGDDLALSFTLSILSGSYQESGDLARAIELQREALELRRRDGSVPWIAGALCNLGVAYAYAGDLEKAKDCYTEALALFEQLGDVRSAAVVTGNLAMTALDQEDLAGARRWASESLQRMRRVGEGLDTRGALEVLSIVALEEGDTRTARLRELEAIQIVSLRRDRPGLARSLATLTCICAAEQADARAARLFGAVSLQLELHGNLLDPRGRVRLDARAAGVREQLGAARYEELHALGRGLGLLDALRLAGAEDALGDGAADLG